MSTPFRRPPRPASEGMATPNVGPFISPFGPLLRRKSLDDTLDDVRRIATAYINGGQELEDEEDDL